MNFGVVVNGEIEWFNPKYIGIMDKIVRYGRMYLDHLEADEARRIDEDGSLLRLDDIAKRLGVFD